MTALSKTFGIAVRNFTAYPEMPDAGRAGRIRRQDGTTWLRFNMGLGPCSPRRAAEFPHHRIADAAHRDCGAHQKDQAGHWYSCSADAQSGHSRKTARQHGSAVERPSHHGTGVGLVQAGVRRGWRAVRKARQNHGRKSRHPETLLDRGHGQGRMDEPQDSGRRDVSQAGAKTLSAAVDRGLCRSRAAARRRGG